MSSDAAARTAPAAGRAGLVGRAVLYVLLGTLALLVAFRRTAEEADSTGALRTLARQPFGRVLVLALAACLAGYAVWRLLEAATGRTSTDEHAGAGARAASVGRGLLYVGLTYAALRLALGDDSSGGAQRQQDLTARVLGWPGGPAVVGLVGAVVAAVGARNLWQAGTADFLRRLGRVPPAVRTLGRVGHLGRGVAFLLVGAFVVRAAFRHDPRQSRGLDGALRQVTEASYGRPLIVVLAVGLLAYGAYTLAEARWRRIRPG